MDSIYYRQPVHLYSKLSEIFYQSSHKQMRPTIVMSW